MCGEGERRSVSGPIDNIRKGVLQVAKGKRRHIPTKVKAWRSLDVLKALVAYSGPRVNLLEPVETAYECPQIQDTTALSRSASRMGWRAAAFDEIPT